MQLETKLEEKKAKVASKEEEKKAAKKKKASLDTKKKVVAPIKSATPVDVVTQAAMLMMHGDTDLDPGLDDLDGIDLNDTSFLDLEMEDGVDLRLDL